MKESTGMSIEEMRDQISLFCETEGFMREAESVYSMPDEEIADYFDAIFTPDPPMIVKEGKFEF